MKIRQFINLILFIFISSSTYHLYADSVLIDELKSALINNQYELIYSRLGKVESIDNQFKFIIADILIKSAIRSRNYDFVKNYYQLHQIPFNYKKMIETLVGWPSLTHLSSLTSKPATIGLKDNRIIAEINKMSINFNLLLSFDEFLVMNRELADRCKVRDISGVIKGVEPLTGEIYYYRMGLLDKLQIANNDGTALTILNIPVKIVSYSDPSLSINIFNHSHIELDYVRQLLTLNDNNSVGTSEKINSSDLIINYAGYIEIPSVITNYNKSIDLIVLPEEKSTILNNFFVDDNLYISYGENKYTRYLERGLFFRNEDVYYHRDFDLLVGATQFYNKTAFISHEKKKNQSNILGFDILSKTVIRIDREKNIIKIINSNHEREHLDHLLTEMAIEDIELFLKQTENVELKNLAEAKLSKWRGNTINALNILSSYIDRGFEKNKTEREFIFYYTIYALEFPTKSELSKIGQWVTKDPALGRERIIKRAIALHDYNEALSLVDGQSGLVSYTVKKNKIYPTLIINNKLTKSFVFDTGCPGIVVDRNSANRLGIKTVMSGALEIRSGFRDNEGIYADLGLIESIDFNGIVVKNFPCYIVEKPLYPGISGAFGGGIINQLNYNIDTVNRTIGFNNKSIQSNELLDKKSMAVTTIEKIDENLKKDDSILIVNEKPYIKTGFINNDGQIEFYYLLFDTGNETCFATKVLANRIGRDKKNTKRKSSGMIDLLGVHFTDIYTTTERLKFVDGVGNSEISVDNFEFRTGPDLYTPDQVNNFGNLGIDFLFKRGIFRIGL